LVDDHHLVAALANPVCQLCADPAAPNHDEFHGAILLAML
jgi:hypothetical protein